MPSTIESRRLPQNVWAFMDSILVECPRCAKMAHVIVKPKDSLQPSGLSCTHCGYAQQGRVTGTSLYSKFYVGLDPFFGLPLWLRQPIGREVVWAYNARHLNDLEFFLEGKWKSHRHNLGLPGYNPNWSWRARYPKWMQEEANRPALLRAVRRMRQRLLK